ncbi:DnaJ domain-containing protein [Collybia nuda]|uniref:DnaJ domain-containing protein n=1 Tax=Collybia nuda TaxID=64659 RepID=A0A9P6CGH0_9AGAR|nr:DnaJ domain-containing protein [Collybia nuda]
MFRASTARVAGGTSSSLYSRVLQQSRCFYSSVPREDHYQTLGVPRHATKAQIKSHFYQLSKTHHPDVAKDARSKDVFNAVSEAYSVLGNDRERRAYDRNLAQQPKAAAQPYHPRAPGQRASRATYAWEYSSRPRHRSKNPSAEWYQHTHPGPQQHKHPGQHYSAPEPDLVYHNLSAHLSGRPRRRANEEERELDKVRRESGLIRAMQVIGLIALSVTMFGGLGQVG